MITTKTPIKVFFISFLFCPLFANHIKANDLPISNFTMEGKDIVEWNENFDTGTTGWDIKSTNTDGFNWKWKNDLTDNKSFKTIDPDDVASIFIEGVYAARHGEQNELLTSPAVEIPENASLKFYAGYSLGSFSVMSIKLKISQDGGKNWTEIWDAEAQSAGGNAFEFRPVRIDLKDYKDKQVQFMWEYKARATMQNMASDLVLDGIEIVTPADIPTKKISAGEYVKFYNTSTGNPTSIQWEFEGGNPATSTEDNPVIYYYRSGSYSVSLTVKNSVGEDKKTKENAIIVDDIAPVIHIGAPTKIRTRESYNYFVPYKEKIQFNDESENYPSRWNWAFTGGELITTNTEPNPIIFYSEKGKYRAALTAGNSKGEDTDEIDVEAGFSSFVWNVNKNESPTTYIQTDQNEYFPGNSKTIEAYAEYFDKPAAPALLDTLSMRFVGYTLGDDILVQIGSVDVSIHKAENGQPGEKIAEGSIRNIDIAAATGAPTGIYFGSDLPCIIDFPFFVVVEGIPMENYDGLKMAIGMVPWRDYGNTAYLKKKGENKFIAADAYFGKGKQTSYCITPRLKYMILHPEKDELIFEGSKEEQKVNVYATFIWTAGSDKSWCKITSTRVEENGSIGIECEKNNTSEERQATITLTNGGNTKTIKVTQKAGGTGMEDVSITDNHAFFDTSGNLCLQLAEEFTDLKLFTIEGRTVFESKLSASDKNSIFTVNDLPKGIYILNLYKDTENESIKLIR